MLTLEGLTKTFGSVRALDNLHLELQTGELVSLLGPSGCGKTTALRSVAGFERPDAGRVLVDGKDLSDVPANKRDMGMVFQAYSLFPTMTASENIEFGLRLRGQSASQRRTRANDLLTLVGLEGTGNRYAHQLSGGQQQRVALARALAIEPAVLLLDEPLSALDAKVRVQLRDEIRRLQRELGITTLFVTHDQEEALSISDRVGVMNQGNLEQVDAPEVLYRSPATEFVAGFVGTINRLPGKALSGDSVNIDGARLHVSVVPGGVQRCVVLVRPESVQLKAVDAATPPGDELRATVTSAGFLGAVRRVVAKTPSGIELIADVSGREGDHLVPGTPVTVSFLAGDASVVADHT
jgi:putative spermidine/putrescine transport system ATP-binding protein